MMGDSDSGAGDEDVSDALSSIANCSLILNSEINLI
jgi:hypothetical protein